MRESVHCKTVPAQVTYNHCLELQNDLNGREANIKQKDGDLRRRSRELHQMTEMLQKKKEEHEKELADHISEVARLSANMEMLKAEHECAMLQVKEEHHQLMIQTDHTMKRNEEHCRTAWAEARAERETEYDWQLQDLIETYEREIQRITDESARHIAPP